MTTEGHKVASLIGGYEGAQRDQIIDAFRSGAAKVLITTNVLARGIDVQTVSMVVNYVCYSVRTLSLADHDRTSRMTTRATPTIRPISIALDGPAASGVSAFPSHLCMTTRAGRCLPRLASISMRRSCEWRPQTGMLWRMSSRRCSRTPQRIPTSCHSAPRLLPIKLCRSGRVKIHGLNGKFGARSCHDLGKAAFCTGVGGNRYQA
jgi:Helicase conserved C-terminal domain